VVVVHFDADTGLMNGVAPHPTTRRLAEITRLVALGEYRIDPYEVADAMICRAEREIQIGRDRRAQNECSYPESSLSASLKTTSGCPSTTAPIQVRTALPVGQAA